MGVIRRAALVACVFAAALSGAAAGEDPEKKPPPSVEELLDDVCDPKGLGERAADVLIARKTDEALVSATKKRLAAETGFHQRLALGYVLAAHGEKEGLEVLVDALKRTGHLGYVYLTRVAPQDFGWNRDGSSLARWREWLAGFTEEEYRRRVARERLPAEARTAGSDEFEAAAKALADGGNRAEVAERFRAFAAKHPMSDAVDDAVEIAGLLDLEAKEDAEWKEPSDPASLSERERIERLVFRLRNARCRRLPLEGWCSCLAAGAKDASKGSNPAAELAAVGAPAIPVLLRLLEDRRPIRATAWSSRRYVRSVVLRYQDAALEILNELLPTPTYRREASASYLSDEEPANRKKTIADVRSWAEKAAGKGADDLAWEGLRRETTRKALDALRRLAVEKGQKEKVLAELRRMYEGGRPWIFRPAICEVMADLGDTSKVAEVLAALDRGEYRSHVVVEEGDSAVGINAEVTARRIRERFGNAKSAPPGEGGDDSEKPAGTK